MRVDLCDFGPSYGFLHRTLKAQAAKEKIDTLDFIKIKNHLCFKGYHQESENKLQNGRKYLLKHIYLIRDLYSEYVKDSYN